MATVVESNEFILSLEWKRRIQVSIVSVFQQANTHAYAHVHKCTARIVDLTWGP